MNEEICKGCGIAYPAGIVNDAFIGGKYVPLCPLCAQDKIGITLRGDYSASCREAQELFLSRHPKIKRVYVPF